jgi:UDP-2,3-diacylglucosamine hydrolase
MTISLSADKKIYFLSDFHLGVPTHADSLVREKIIIQFLDNITPTAQHIFIMGDMFDFWYEYKTVVPKGFVRLLGKLATMVDNGINISFFVGNHDMWMYNYFETELGITVYYNPIDVLINDTTFYLAHGDGLGPGDNGYKILKKLFRNPVCKWLFGWLHPNMGIGLANYSSQASKNKNGNKPEQFLGEKNEWLYTYAKQVLQKKQYHYFIFGHRHLPLQLAVSPQCQYINLGDWIYHFTYAVFDGKNTQLLTWQNT